ncbi:hypothetical protein ACH5RR_025716 [Cinchona calisaya]|uniref:Peptidylprolyl isomerase n=1 Tax=Cinchona calisaya TaxID=153742 RepID=A0ABD2Z0F2_9GENT
MPDLQQLHYLIFSHTTTTTSTEVHRLSCDIPPPLPWFPISLPSPQVPDLLSPKSIGFRLMLLPWRKKIVAGSLMKAVIRPGDGGLTLADGDQVYHCTVRTLNGVAVKSTRREFGGDLHESKCPLDFDRIPSVSRTLIPGFKIKPEIHYGEEDCPVSVDDRFLKDSELHIEIELIDFSKVKASISHQLNFLM